MQETLLNSVAKQFELCRVNRWRLNTAGLARGPHKKFRHERGAVSLLVITVAQHTLLQHQHA